jgi:hypothetical protein
MASNSGRAERQSDYFSPYINLEIIKEWKKEVDVMLWKRAVT